MPFGNDDWLALTEETPIEPAIPLCDPHHHFWDRRLPSIPYQRYLLHELMADVDSGHNVRSTVFVEARSMYRAAGPDELRPVGEVEFVQGLAAASASGVYGETRAAAAIVGHADLKLGQGVAPVLETLQAASPNRFKGIRHNVTWSPDPSLEDRETQGIMSNDTFRAGARVLAGMGLSLDVMLSFPQLNELADFARAVPELPIILNHLVGLAGRVFTPGGTMRSYRRGGRVSVLWPLVQTSPARSAEWECRAGASAGTPGTFPSVPRSWRKPWHRG